MVDLIIKKRAGEVLTNEEIKFFIDGYVNDSIPDYQISALLMAICFQGMNEDETAFLTKCMIESGDTIDLNKINGIKVDKHSTGGVGDKTSLVLGPIVAACGGKVAKMSGRGLGHTGGTLDKLESIPNMKIGLTIDEFINQVNKIGLSIIGQTQDLVPADKKLYALRDVTGTVESIPLIASSIMSKKLATGADAILLDVKWGSGAFFKTVDGAKELAKTMVKLGNNLNKSTKAMITDMDNPLGKAIGNILEVKEAIETLKGNGPDDLVELCVNAAAIMLTQSNIASTIEEGKAMALNSIKDGSAFNKFRLMVEAQAGDVSYIDDLNRFPVAKNIIPVTSEQEGYISHIDALTLGVEAMHLGAGRKTKDDVIDYTAGITLEVKPLDKVNKGDVLAYLHTNIDDYQDIINKVRKAFTFSKRQVEKSPIIHEIIE
jgi:pyrimidine-nucleoside phosphorylase